MKKTGLFLILILFFTGCAGYESEELEDFNNSEFANEEPVPDRDPDSEQEPGPTPPVAPTPAPDPEPFRCIKSLHHDPQFMASKDVQVRACKKASKKQLAEVNKGNAKKEAFLKKCYKETGNSCWCDQLTRPNPSSINSFRCTYGSNQPHQLIHPDEKTWKHAIEAAKIVLDLEKKGIGVKIIYNWWRPEPYNQNVGGAAGRHPYGTSVDVRFVSKSDQNKAHKELCKMRKKGRIRALGYYKSTALHLGVGDRSANTWGKSCP